MMNFKDLVEYCQIQAILNKIEPDNEAHWRFYCRQYSKKFATPYHEALNLAPETVVLAFYEDRLESVDLEDPDALAKILDTVYSIEDPEYENEKNKEIEEFMEQAAEEEAERIRQGIPLHAYLLSKQKKTSKNSILEDKNSPKGGSLDLSYLEKEESEGGGFEE